MLLIKELLEARAKKVVTPQNPFPFDAEWNALRARSGRPGKKTSPLSDEEVERLKMIETIWSSRMDHDEEDPAWPKSGPALWSDIPGARYATCLLSRKGRISVEQAGNNGVKKNVQDISAMYKGDDAEVAKKLRKKQLNIERSYPDTIDGWIEAAEHFYHLS